MKAGAKGLVAAGVLALVAGSVAAAAHYGLIRLPELERRPAAPSATHDAAAAADERSKLLEENLALKVRNSALEIDLLAQQGRLNKVVREHDHAMADLERSRAELAAAQRQLAEAAEASAAERARSAELAAAHADGLAREQEKAQQLTRELAEAQRLHKQEIEAHAAELAKLRAKQPEPIRPAPPAAAPLASKGPVPEFVAALHALALAFRADKDAAKAKERLFKATGASFGEADLERHLAALVDKKALSSWTKYGNPSDGLGYVLVAKLADNRFVGVVNLSFGTLLKGQPGKIVDVEVLDQFFPVEIRSEENWDEARVSWFYDSGGAAGAVSPHFAALRAPWTISDFLRAVNHLADQGRPPEERTKIFATGGKRDAARPISLADFEKKLPDKFERFSSSADALSGQPRLNVAMHRKSAGLDVAGLTGATDFNGLAGLGPSVEALFTASLTPAARKSVPLGGPADLYGRVAALILMPDFSLDGLVANPDAGRGGDVRAARLAASYADGVGRRQTATLDFRRDDASPDGRWRLAALKREPLLAADLPAAAR